MHAALTESPVNSLRKESVRAQPQSTGQNSWNWCAECGYSLLVGLLVGLFCGCLWLHDANWFWHDDYQIYQLATYGDVARSWMEGEFPLLSPYSWQCSALAAEFQNGVFSLFLTGLIVLLFGYSIPLPVTAAILSTVHLAILAMGTFRLARGRDLARNIAFFVALTTTLSGWIMIWGAKAWLPALASFAWFPWVWWSFEKALHRDKSWLRFVLPGLFLYLLITAGWPYTILMTMFLTAWLGLKTWHSGQRIVSAWPLVAAWLVGLGLSAPAWLMLVEYSRESVRARLSPWHIDATMAVPLWSLPSLIFPPLWSSWSIFGERRMHMGLELAGSLVPIVILLAAWRRADRRCFQGLRWELWLCIITLALAILPSMSVFRWSFRWLPFFALALALTSGHVLARLRALNHFSSPSQGNTTFGPLAICLVVAGGTIALLQGFDTTSYTLYFTVTLSVTCLLWTVVGKWSAPQSFLRLAMPSVVVVVSTWMTYANISPSLAVPHWQLTDASAQQMLNPNRRYFSLHAYEDIFNVDAEKTLNPIGGTGESLFPGNTGMYSRVEMINGYSPVQPNGLTDMFGFGIHGYVFEKSAFSVPGGSDFQQVDVLLRRESGPDGLLALMGVDGLVLANRFCQYFPILEEQGWQKHAATKVGVVFHRAGKPGPRIHSIGQVQWTNDWLNALRSWHERPDAEAAHILFDKHAAQGKLQTFARAEVSLLSTSRNSAVAQVHNTDSNREALIVFSRPWLPGYEAQFNGQLVPVERFDLIMPAIRLPKGTSGELVLQYSPKSLIVGCWVAALTMLLLLAMILLALWQVVHRARVLQRRYPS